MTCRGSKNILLRRTWMGMNHFSGKKRQVVYHFYFCGQSKKRILLTEDNFVVLIDKLNRLDGAHHVNRTSISTKHLSFLSPVCFDILIVSWTSNCIAQIVFLACWWSQWSSSEEKHSCFRNKHWSTRWKKSKQWMKWNEKDFSVVK